MDGINESLKTFLQLYTVWSVCGIKTLQSVCVRHLQLFTVCGIYTVCVCSIPLDIKLQRTTFPQLN